jgi:uncharacterized protein (TIGR02145 family)
LFIKKEMEKSMKNLSIIILLLVSMVLELSAEPPDNETIRICKSYHVWMKKNLDVEKYNNGEPILQCTTVEEWKLAAEQGQGAWCYYDFDSSKGTKYGKLYNWYAVNDPRGLAPVGWHIPSKEEFETLIECFGGKDLAGGKLKDKGTIESNDGLWKRHTTSSVGTNESGFTGLPGGFWSKLGTNTFQNLSKYGYWWTIGSIGIQGNSFELEWNNTHATFRNQPKVNGLSVRCIKD